MKRITFNNKKTVCFFLLIILISIKIHAQEKIVRHETYFEEEDLKYEIEHKNQPWFSKMEDGVNYFEVKKKYDTYFGNHKWEKSKPRTLGETWLKTKIFYLDGKGNVQPEPKINLFNTYNSPLNISNNITTRQIGTWELLGPVNSATTTYSGTGNHGGYVYLNRIDPTNTQKMFVSFLTGGLWMTANAGESWTLVDSNLLNERYLDLDVSISNPQIVYAINKRQVIKSVDGGLNWLATSLTDESYSGRGYEIAVSRTDPNIVVARWDNKLYRTIDGGGSWNVVQINLPIHSLWDGSLASEMLDWSTSTMYPNVVYSLSTGHDNKVLLHRSLDSGATFQLFKEIILDTNAEGNIVGWAKLLLPTNNLTSIYVVVGSGEYSRGHSAAHLYKLNAATGATELSRINMIDGKSESKRIHHGDIAMDRNNENIIVWGTYSKTIINISTDNGASFTPTTANTHSDIRTVDVVDNRILVGSDGESVLSTDAGVTLTTITNSISNHELWGFGSAFKSDIVASGNNHGPVMIKEAANGFEWYNGTGADQGNTDVNPLDDRYVYSQGYSNYRYFRTGPHQLINESNFLDLGGIYSYFNSIEFHPNKYYTMITHHAGGYPSSSSAEDRGLWKRSLIKTEDNGNSISIVKTFENQVFRDKISMKNPNHMYVVEGLSNNRLWHTNDAGVTWGNITPSTTDSFGQKNISDIAVSDENPNEVWVTYSGVQNVCKVLKSSDYGQTWVNITGESLTEYPTTKIIFQRGSNGGVYIGDKSGVYYKNNDMIEWVKLGSGLPMADIRFLFINYNQNKLKVGTSRGAFMHDLHEISPTNALISVNSSKITCPLVEKLSFKDYSVVRNESATWSWSFSGGTPSTSTEENPEVSYMNASEGFYDVALTVTDEYGTSTQVLENFIEVTNLCGSRVPDKVPGNAAKIEGTGSSRKDFLEIKDLNVYKQSFTFSCWIKPDGTQVDYSPIFLTKDSNSTFGLNFKDGNNSIGIHPNWGLSTGLQTPSGKWSHLAMSSDENGVRIYVDGVEKIDNSPVENDLITEILIGYFGRNFYSRYTNMEIDEISIWNRSLSKDEIRKCMHLTKSNANAPISNGLVAYYQFNETSGDFSLNKVGSNDIKYVGENGVFKRTVSTAPVFDGISKKINVNSAGVKNFEDAGVKMVFGNGTKPNGDVWVSKSTIEPDTKPDNLMSFNTYFVVNNHGVNKTFTSLNSISFTVGNEYSTTPSNGYNSFKRKSTDFGDTWGTKIDSGDDVISTSKGTEISFSTDLIINSFSQFLLTNSNSTLGIDNVNLVDEKVAIYPNPVSFGSSIKVDLPIKWSGASMTLYNTIGNKVGELTLNSGINQVKLNLSSGVYFAVIHNKKIKYHHKIILE